MDLARLPAPRTESTPEPTAKQVLQTRLASYLADGMTYSELAEKLAKGDKRKARQWRHKLRRWAATDDYFREILIVAAQAEMVMALQPATQALARRAARGNPQAIKLLFEATGFHNPKVKHEHSGEVKVKLEVGGQVSAAPRPAPVEDVVDAEVVE